MVLPGSTIRAYALTCPSKPEGSYMTRVAPDTYTNSLPEGMSIGTHFPKPES